ncbi:hypothetical protein H5410_028160 [Solanum commersonii]|uniref:Uncharacterized protein n=1 Tax=Solanum commersonii TaxID=4109 RepID=A0A9J5Z5E0_SOLCO|nr:hypothetical protein H5410_028160 [Solanum commersonii]
MRVLMEDSLRSGTTLVVDRYSYLGVAFSSAKGLDIEWCKVTSCLTSSILLFCFLDKFQQEPPNFDILTQTLSPKVNATPVKKGVIPPKKNQNTAKKKEPKKISTPNQKGQKRKGKMVESPFAYIVTLKFSRWIPIGYNNN